MQLCVMLKLFLFFFNFFFLTLCAFCTFRKNQMNMFKVQVSVSAAIHAGGWFVGFRNCVSTAARWLPAEAFLCIRGGWRSLNNFCFPCCTSCIEAYTS